MSIEENKALLRRWIDIWHAQNTAAVDDLVTSDYVRHDPTMPDIHGPAAEKQLMTAYLTAFPDLRFTIDNMIAEGDRVAVHLTARGTHQGDLMGIPPTGKSITVAIMEIYRMTNGKIAEQWVSLDNLGMMQQIGAIPTM